MSDAQRRACKLQAWAYMLRHDAAHVEEAATAQMLDEAHRLAPRDEHTMELRVQAGCLSTSIEVVARAMEAMAAEMVAEAVGHTCALCAGTGEVSIGSEQIACRRCQVAPVTTMEAAG